MLNSELEAPPRFPVFLTDVWIMMPDRWLLWLARLFKIEEGLTWIFEEESDEEAWTPVDEVQVRRPPASVVSTLHDRPRALRGRGVSAAGPSAEGAVAAYL